MNPFGGRGGRKRKADTVRPTEVETLAMSVAMAMLLCRVKMAMTQAMNFREKIVRVLKDRFGVLQQAWPNNVVRGSESAPGFPAHDT